MPPYAASTCRVNRGQSGRRFGKRGKKVRDRSAGRIGNGMAFQVLRLFQSGVFAAEDRLWWLAIDNRHQFDRDLIVGARQHQGAGIGKAEHCIAGADLPDGIDRALAANDLHVEPGVPVIASVERVEEIGVPAIVAKVGDQGDRVERGGGARAQEHRRSGDSAHHPVTPGRQEAEHLLPLSLATELSEYNRIAGNSGYRNRRLRLLPTTSSRRLKYTRCWAISMPPTRAEWPGTSAHGQDPHRGPR